MACSGTDGDPATGDHLEVDHFAGGDARDGGDPVGVVVVVADGDLVVPVPELEDSVRSQQVVGDRFEPRVLDRGVGFEGDGTGRGAVEVVSDRGETAVVEFERIAIGGLLAAPGDHHAAGHRGWSVTAVDDEDVVVGGSDQVDGMNDRFVDGANDFAVDRDVIFGAGGPGDRDGIGCAVSGLAATGVIVGVDGKHAECDGDELRVDGRVGAERPEFADADPDEVFADESFGRRDADVSGTRIDGVVESAGERGHLRGLEPGGEFGFAEEFEVGVTVRVVSGELECGDRVGFHADVGDIVEERVAVGIGVGIDDDGGVEAADDLVAEGVADGDGDG